MPTNQEILDRFKTENPWNVVSSLDPHQCSEEVAHHVALIHNEMFKLVQKLDTQSIKITTDIITMLVGNEVWYKGRVLIYRGGERLGKWGARSQDLTRLQSFLADQVFAAHQQLPDDCWKISEAGEYPILGGEPEVVTL
jgi:hypothetical protein